MDDSSKTNDGSAGEVKASSLVQRVSETDAAVCYRMEPSKQLLSVNGCGALCPSHNGVGAEGNESPPCLLCDQAHVLVDLANVRRIALMVTPQATGSVVDQIWEAISTIRTVVNQQTVPMTVTTQTVYLKRAEDMEACRKLFEAYFGDRMPATNYVVQPPCGGQALAIEAWALGGDGVDVQFPEPDVVSISYDGLRWIHTAEICPPRSADKAFLQSQEAFEEAARRLETAGSSFHDVVRIWLYLGSITEIEDGIERYRELNRARSDFFVDQESQGRMQIHRDGRDFYPASTGIGMAGDSLTISCMTLQTDRDDVRLIPLENPRQTSAFNYSERFSVKSPKFSRAMAVVIGDYVTTWISGTASIVDSETVHVGDVAKQTEQTIDNIEALIGRENFARHGIPGAGARLSDLAKVRVYVKRPEDYEVCRAICERRFGALPIIYAQADVCRPDLLVEIEGVAFSRMSHASDDE